MSEDRPKRPLRRRSYADEDRVRDLIDDVYRFSEKRYPFLIGTFAWLLREIGKSFAFSVKVLMRRNLGSRTYGLILAMDAYFVQKLFLFLFAGGTKGSLTALVDLVTFDERTTGIFDDFFWGAGWAELYGNWIDRHGFLWAAGFSLQYFIGYAFLLRCAFVLWDRLRRRMGRVKTFTYSSGESIFFGWLKERGVSDQVILMVVEPAAVYLFGVILYGLGEHSALGPFLMVCGVALFFEEYVPYARRREKVLDKLDAEFEMARLQNMMAAYDASGQGGWSKNVPAALANEKDAERYKAEMGRLAGRKGDAARLRL